MIDNMNSTYAKIGNLGALLAFPFKNEHVLCEFSIDDFQPELKDSKIWFTTMGSTVHLTDSFLAFLKEIFWKEHQPDLADGIFAATWTLQHAIDVNPGGVNGPISIATLSKKNKDEYIAKKLDKNELEEHQQNIEEAKKYMKKYLELHKSDSAKMPPFPPQKK